MPSRFRSLVDLRILAALALLCFLSAAPHRAHAIECLADIHNAASGDYGYRLRESRCEGLLRRFVASASSVDLLGFQFGPLDLRASMDPATSIVALGIDAGRAVTLRAKSLTSRTQYQMDRVDSKLGTPFRWPADVVRGATQVAPDPPLDVSKIALVACSDLCSDRPDTVFWPVGMQTLARPASVAFALLLRSDARANIMAARLHSLADNKKVEMPALGVVLSPDNVTVLLLPAGLEPGYYKLTVEAREVRTREPLGVLIATLCIPLASK